MPPDFVLAYLPLELLGVITAIAAAAWGIRVLLDINRRVRAWAQPWVAWLHRFRESWDGTPEVRDSGGSVVRHASPGVPARLDGYDDKFVGFERALAENAEANATIAKGQQDLRELVSDAMREIGEFRREYTRDLRHNHPDYDPDAD